MISLFRQYNIISKPKPHFNTYNAELLALMRMGALGFNPLAMRAMLLYGERYRITPDDFYTDLTEDELRHYYSKNPCVFFYLTILTHIYISVRNFPTYQVLKLSC